VRGQVPIQGFSRLTYQQNLTLERPSFLGDLIYIGNEIGEILLKHQDIQGLIQQPGCRVPKHRFNCATDMDDPSLEVGYENTAAG